MSTGEWLPFWGPDPRAWLRAAAEPSARWVCATELDQDRTVAEAARQEVLAHPAVQELIGRLPTWTVDAHVSGHQAATYAPNVLHLLAELGVRGGDDPRIERLLDQMLAHQDQTGRFEFFARVPGHEEPMWGSLACDTNTITEAMVRFGRSGDERVRAALDGMAAAVTTTDQGPGWACEPHSTAGWRGPGRRGDICPQVTLEALRTFARLPASERPPGLDEVVRSTLEVWRRRSVQHPHMFGHGIHFATVKWPPLWYGAWLLLDTVGRYPEVWSSRAARDEDRQSVAELVASFVVHNVAADGRVSPTSCYRGFGSFSFGVKGSPSPIATAMVAAVARRFEPIAEDVLAVDVSGLRGTPAPAA